MSYLEIIEKLKKTAQGSGPERGREPEYEKHERNELGSKLETEAPARLDSLRWWEPGAVCWHCQGSGACKCIACDSGRLLEPQPGLCLVCQGLGKLRETVQ